MKRTELKRTPLRAKKMLAKKAKPKSRGWYAKRLDDIAKRFAKERDGYICQMTGQQVEGSNAHGSHVIPVSAGNALRWDLDNIKCLSYHSHINKWHLDPTSSTQWFKDKFPDRWEYLKSMRGAEFHVTNAELAEFYQMALKCQNWREYQRLYNEVMR